jgi:tetratricopeptide (TPR) repeat protein
MARPVNRIDLIKKAEYQLKQNNYDEALGYITQCLDFFPAFSPAKVLLAEVYLKKGKLDFALKELSSIISDTPDNLRARKLIIETLVESGNVKEAVSHLNFLEFVMPSDDSELLRLKQLFDENSSLKITENDNSLSIENSAVVNDDEVTEVFNTEELFEKVDNEDTNPVMSEENQIVTVTLDDKDHNNDEPEIKTMTLASIYEKQGMLTEALDILEKLYGENKDEKVLSEIKRLKMVIGGKENNSLNKLKIKKLTKWLEKINAIG